MLGQAHRPVVSRPGRLEKSDGVGPERLSLYAGVPESRDLQFDFAIATRGGFRTKQHRGRASQTLDGGVQAVSRKCPGLSDGSRDADSNRSRSRLSGAESRRRSAERRSRSRSNSKWSPSVSSQTQWPVISDTGPQTKLRRDQRYWPLITGHCLQITPVTFP